MPAAIRPRTGHSVLGALAVLIVALAVMVGSSAVSRAWFTDSDTTGASLAADTLAPPTGLGAAGGSNVVLTWTATTDAYAAGYHVFRSTAVGGPYAQIAVVTPRTTVTYTDNPANGTYWYQVRSYLQSWESLDAGPVSATVGAPVSTGYKPCLGTSNAADTSGAGNNNGYETNANRACASDAAFAVDSGSGTGGTASCGTGATPDPAKDRHRWWGYALGLPGSVTSIDGIEVQATLQLNNNGGTTNICTQLSWDGGTSWTTIKSLNVSGGTSTTTYTFGAASDTWGHTWTPGQLGASNFVVRVIDASTQGVKSFSLDYLSAQITYTP